MIATIASQQVTALRRQRVFTAMLATLLTMTALAGVIGWLSHDTIVRVYNDATDVLAAAGQPAPPNPFDLKPTLSMLSNMAVYIPLIGALVAIVLGHLTLAEDRSEGLGRLVFVRQPSRRDYLAGKLVAIAAVLGAVIGFSVLVSATSLVLVNHAVPSFGDLGRLLGFYALSWLYLALFALVGVVTVLLVRRRSLALLAALGVWLVLTFALPQFTSGLLPSASLNPVVNPAGTTQTFFRATALARPISVSEQYKAVAGQVLRTAPREPAFTTALRVVPLAASTLALAALSLWLVTRSDFSEVDDDA